ncbi:MAG: sigma-70 family RNA polymerase sigma factor [Pirellula sp.]|jgi:RNA polymerase sigma-70 factor (ECF subfamily)|nr:sigma-70 family RNA polymerase sigma factor [Pirellula sp.]
MVSTSVSLLKRLRTESSEVDWSKFVDIYAPIIFYWGRQKGLKPDDAADLVQDVLADLVTKLRTFEYDPKQRFRGWLRTITVNRAINSQRRNAKSPQTGQETKLLFASAEDDNDLLSDAQYYSQLALQTLHLMQQDVEPTTWKAGWLQLVEGRKAQDVARELGISINAAYLAKSRLLNKLRTELDGLHD